METQIIEIMKDLKDLKSIVDTLSKAIIANLNEEQTIRDVETMRKKEEDRYAKKSTNNNKR